MAIQVRVNLCPHCAAELRRIRDAQGVPAMAASLSRVLCKECRKQLPRPDEPFESRLKHHE